MTGQEPTVIFKLFKELLSLFKQVRKDEREQLEKVCTPLYNRLEPIAAQYFQLISRANSLVHESDPQLERILGLIKEERGRIILIRNGIIGEAAGILENPRFSRGAPILVERQNFSDLCQSFAENIVAYFNMEDYQEQTTIASTFMILLGNLIKYRMTKDWSPEDDKNFLGVLRYAGDDMQRYLEYTWTDVAKNYGTLKAFCRL